MTPRGLPATPVGTTSDRPNLGVKIDERDPRYQLWFLGDVEIMRLTVEQARKMAGLALKTADRQEQRSAGATVQVPTGYGAKRA
jgi:hypothetical protein